MPVTKDGRYHTVWRDHQNSTSTLLAAGGTWTGQATENNHRDVSVYVLTDVPGTLRVCFSTDDGANWDFVNDYQVEAGTPFEVNLVKGNRGCFIEYLNGGAAQKIFRLQTDFGDFPASQSGEMGGSQVELVGPQVGTPTGDKAFATYDSQTELLADGVQEVIDELKIMNMHLAQMTGFTLSREDV